jgi:tetratricopeptide (TPR) repeat protein
MYPALLLLTLAVSVKDTAVLRNGCGANDDTIVTLAPGEPLTIRYRLASEAGPCYKVATQADGKPVEGYLPAAAIAGLDDFEKGLRDATWVDVTQAVAAIKASTAHMPSLASGVPSAIAAEASKLIDSSRPLKALELIEPELIKRRDPGLLALAGLAAWRADDSRKALEYWRQSLEIHPNPDIEGLYRRVERETRGDQSTDRLVGMRVMLRYEAAAVPIETARAMLGVLDEEYARISAQLGCSAEERIVAIVQSRDAYRKTIDAAEWNGGQFDGRIRVPVMEGQGMDASTRRTFAHETVHACLSMIGRWPVWLHEGLAQKLSGDTLSPAVVQRLADMAQKKKLPRLENLGQDWSRLDTEHAQVAYALALAGVEQFFANYAQLGIANLLRNRERLPDITADLDKRLGL